MKMVVQFPSGISMGISHFLIEAFHTNSLKCYSFPATDVETIKRFVKKPMSKFVYVVVAQTLDERVPPFILQIFGTNGTLTAHGIIQRWEYTKSELQKYVISVKDSSFFLTNPIINIMQNILPEIKLEFHILRIQYIFLIRVAIDY